MQLAMNIAKTTPIDPISISGGIICNYLMLLSLLKFNYNLF